MASGNQLSSALERVLRRTSLNELRHMFPIWIRWLVNFGSERALNLPHSAHVDHCFLGVLRYPGFPYQYSHFVSDVTTFRFAPTVILHKLPLTGILSAILRFIATFMRSHEDARLAFLEGDIFTLLLAVVDGEVRGALEHRVPPPPFTELSLEGVIQEASKLLDELRTSKKVSRDWRSLRDIVQATAGDGSDICCDAYESAREVFLQLCEE